MSTTDELSNEDLENVALVRMEDIQPARDRSIEYSSPEVEDQEVETCVVESIDYDSVCVVNDDSDISRTMSIHAKEVDKDDDSGEYEVVYEVKQEAVCEDSKPVKSNLPDSWPTLEILPGGVIKHADRLDDDYNTLYGNEIDSDNVNMEDMMYACAKCSQKFKYLFSLVKHVKWHENEKKIKSNINCLKNEYVNKKTKNGVTTRQKKRKVEIIVTRAVPRLEHLLTHGQKKNVHTKL